MADRAAVEPYPHLSALSHKLFCDCTAPTSPATAVGSGPIPEGVSDPFVRQVLLDSHQLRNALLEAAHKCTVNHLPIPAPFEEVLATLSHSNERQLYRGRVASPNFTKISAQSSSTERAPSSLSAVDAEHQRTEVLSNSVALSFPTNPREAENADQATVVRRFLDEAHSARMDGDRRKELQVLTEYLCRAKQGQIFVDDASARRLLRRIAEAHASLGEYERAEQCLFDWYLIADRVRDVEDATRALTHLGKLAHTRGDLVHAEEWYAKAQDSYRTIHSSPTSSPAHASSTVQWAGLQEELHLASSVERFKWHKGMRKRGHGGGRGATEKGW